MAPTKNPLDSGWSICFLFLLIIFAFAGSLLLGLNSASGCSQYFYYSDPDSEDGVSTEAKPCPATFEYTCTGTYNVRTADDIHYRCAWQTREKVLGGVALFLLLPFSILVTNSEKGFQGPKRARLLFLMTFSLLGMSAIFLTAAGFMLSMMPHGDIEGVVSQGGYKACASIFLGAGIDFVLITIFFFWNIRGDLGPKIFRINSQRVVIPSSPTPLPLT